MAKGNRLEQRVILHVGLHKTGTTSIQNALFEQREVLLQNGILYPNSGLELKAPAVGRRHLHLKLSVATEGAESLALARLAEEVRASACHSAVVSHEALFAPDVSPGDVLLGLKGFHVEVVVYLRNPVDYLESKYREWVRNVEFSGEISRFLRKESDWLDISKRVSDWRDAVGAERLHIHSFDHLEPQTNLAVHMLGSVGLEINLSPPNLTNPSLGNERYLAHLMANRLRRVARKVPSTVLDEVVVPYSGNQGRLLPDDALERVIREYGRVYDNLITQLGLNDQKEAPSRYAKLPFDSAFYSREVRQETLARLEIGLRKHDATTATMIAKRQALARQKEVERKALKRGLRDARKEIRRLNGRLETLKFWRFQNLKRYPSLLAKRLLK